MKQALGYRQARHSLKYQLTLVVAYKVSLRSHPSLSPYGKSLETVWKIFPLKVIIIHKIRHSNPHTEEEGRRGGGGHMKIQWGNTSSSEPFFSRTRKLPCIFAVLFVGYSSRLRLRDSLLRPCYDFLLFFTTQTRPVHRETDSGDEKFITPINKIHNPILGYGLQSKSSPRG